MGSRRQLPQYLGSRGGRAGLRTEWSRTQRIAPAAAPTPAAEGGASLTALATLYTTEFTRFVRVATAITGDSESARDVVQDAFANLVQHRAEHRADGNLAGWAWRAVVNGANSERRARAYSARAAERLAALHRPDAGDDAHDTSLRALLRDLPERQREVVFLRYYADLDYTTIAEALSLSPGTVGATLNAARASLRAALQEEGR